MEYVILGLLIINKQTIYELNKSFEQSVSLFYSASFGSLQAAIKKLLKNGFITFEEGIESGRNKKIYAVTELGREAFFQWMSADITDKKLEVASLSRVFLLGLIGSKEEKIRIIKSIIEKHQIAEKHLVMLKESIGKLEIPKSKKQISHYKIKTLDYGISSYRFAIDWFQDLLRDTEAKE